MDRNSHNVTSATLKQGEEVIFPDVEKDYEIKSSMMGEGSKEIKSETPDWCLENIAEISRSARTIHTVYIGFLIYCILTIRSTPDRKIILDELVHLPIINLDVSFSGFVLIAPLLGIINFVYLQLHLQVVKRAIDRLQAKYGPIEKGRLYPWMVSLADEPEDGVIGKLQRIIVNISLWWLLPIVLFLFIILTLKKHHNTLTLFEWAISCAGTYITLWFWYRYENLTGKTIYTSQQIMDRLFSNLVKHYHVACLSGLTILAYIILAAMMLQEKRGGPSFFRVNLSNEILVKEQKEEYEVYWADLQDSHLEGAMLDNSVLKKANLARSQLNGAKLELANLEQANLYYANLSAANLNCAKLLKADLRAANLSNAFLVKTKLKGANVNAYQLSTALTLFKVELDEGLQTQISQMRPDLLQAPYSEKEIMKLYPPNAEFKEVTIPEYLTLVGYESVPPQEEKSLISDSTLLVYEETAQWIAKIRYIHKMGLNSQSQYFYKIYLSEKMIVPGGIEIKSENH